MKTTNWLCWLLFACICLTEARYKLRRPPLPPPLPPTKLLFKKSWPNAHRVSMGNQIHMSGNFPLKRLSHKPPNYRIRRPPLFNVLPNVWKNQMPMRTPMNNHAVLPQRPPVKEFHSMHKMPEYSPEYRPEVTVLPPTHRGGIDDDKGPIHTIPAPNLSPLDRPFNINMNHEEDGHRHQYATDVNYKPSLHTGPLVPSIDLATIGTSLAPQRTVTSPTPTQHQYEVTEGNELNQKEYHTVHPTFLPSEFDVTRLSTLVNPELQSNEVLLNHHPVPNVGLVGTNIQFGQANTPMQTNLHSSLHVGFPGTAGQVPYMINQQIPDLHVGHPAPAGPPMSATQLYDLLNSFPQKLTEQYQSGQQPQLQQHLLQQQLGQLLQPGAVHGFTQPQMHSFNYNEQDNVNQQQQFVFGPEYLDGRVNTDYNVGTEQTADAQSTDGLPSNDEVAYVNDGTEQVENNIDYEETNSKGQSTYFNKVSNNGDISTQFYTTLPSREAAEKLAALAAAGNVNSQLLEQLRKQQQEKLRNDESLPANHKHEDYEATRQTDNGEAYDDEQNFQQDEDYRADERQQHYNKHNNEQQLQRYDEQKKYETQQTRQQNRRPQNHYIHNEKRPLRIMVPDEETYVNDGDRRDGEENENVEAEYEYENDDAEVASSPSNPSYDGRTSYEQSTAEFGTRLSSKTGK